MTDTTSNIYPEKKICSKCGKLGNLSLDPRLSDFSKDGKRKDGSVRFRSDCKDCGRKTSRNYYKNHRNRLLNFRKSYHLENQDRICSDKRLYEAEIRAKQLKRAAAWRDLKAIAEFYKIAHTLSQATGTPYHVDHIHPYHNDLICGLHVETNLQVIPAKSNIKKHNTFQPYRVDQFGNRTLLKPLKA